MRITPFIPAVLLMATAMLCGCRSEKKNSGEKWKPWAETAEHDLSLRDSTLADSLGSTSDTLALHDSIMQADSIRQASVHDSHQILRGHAGNKEVYLNFSTINGTHLIGNALIDGHPTEITGSTSEEGDIRHFVIDESRAVGDSLRFRMEATSTPTGIEGTYREGSHVLPLRLER